MRIWCSSSRGLPYWIYITFEYLLEDVAVSLPSSFPFYMFWWCFAVFQLWSTKWKTFHLCFHNPSYSENQTYLLSFFPPRISNLEGKHMYSAEPNRVWSVAIHAPLIHWCQKNRSKNLYLKRTISLSLIPLFLFTSKVIVCKYIHIPSWTMGEYLPILYCKVKQCRTQYFPIAHPVIFCRKLQRVPTVLRTCQESDVI